ncbi:MAG: hypothetical protein AMXMBFR12_04780 [Candidatus Babeliales bacterium]
MEELKKAHSLTISALKTLKESFDIAQLAEKEKREGFILAAKDSMIQRFEYSYDSFWKLLKRYLEQEIQLEDITSPKKVFRACVKHGICTQNEGDILIQMADDRNTTSHNYNIQQVRIIIPDIPTYYTTMIHIIDKLKLKS